MHIVQPTPHTAVPAGNEYRRLFPALERVTFLNTCSLGAMTAYAGIVMFPAPDPAAVVRALAVQRIILDDRPGRVRVSPYFYNTVEEHQILVDHLVRHLHAHDAGGIIKTI